MRSRIGYLPPRLISPEGIHSIDIFRINTIWIFPEYVAVNVGNGKVEEDFNTLHFTCFRDYFPIQMEPVRVEDANRPPIVLIANPWKYFLQQELV